MAIYGSQDWVVSKLGKYKQLLWRISETAIIRLNAIPPASRLPWNARVIANVLNAYVIDEARKAFDGAPHSRFIEANGTTYQILDRCALWYKQLGPDGLPSNYPTETALDMMQGSFPFAPKSFLLVVGFQPDPTLQKIEMVVIQRFRAEGKIQFYIEMEKVVLNANRDVIAMPQAISESSTTKTRIRFRKGPEQQKLPALGDA